MNYFATFVLFAAAGPICLAADVATLNMDEHFQVERIPFGSGTPTIATTPGTETAEIVVDGVPRTKLSAWISNCGNDLAARVADRMRSGSG